MVFSSIIFLFFFLPLTLLLYGVVRGRKRNILLLFASLLFYAWGEGVYLLVMLLSIAVNYLCGLLMWRGEGYHAKKVLVAGILINLAILGFFKYANFLVDNINILLSLMGWPALVFDMVHLPIGISLSSPFRQFPISSTSIAARRRRNATSSISASISPSFRSSLPAPSFATTP